ncbi:hypothetical protein CASFOL_007947 [Castilleja foliolosa]|uniref:Ycf1 n=1 Tax=Castilleja foliolosa TaxID=1961234 RepID=A0ABD3E1Y3_9LAMI
MRNFFGGGGRFGKDFGFIHNDQIISGLVSTFPVILDTIFKYWIFRYLNRLIELEFKGKKAWNLNNSSRTLFKRLRGTIRSNKPFWNKYSEEIVSKRHSYEKDPLIDSNTQFEVYSLSNPNENFQKYYRYDLLSYKFLDYEKKTECFFYRSPFQGNKNQGVSYTSKEALLDMPRNIPINNYLSFSNGLQSFSVREDPTIR